VTNVSAKAYLDHQMLMHAEANGFLIPSIHAVEDRYQLPRGQLGSHLDSEVRCLSLLYLLLVYPKERFSRDKVQSDALAMGFSIDELSKSGAKMAGIADEEDLLRKLRNSVAHADLDVSPSGVSFRGQSNCSREYDINFPWDVLSVLLSKIGEYFANRRSVNKG